MRRRNVSGDYLLLAFAAVAGLSACGDNRIVSPTEGIPFTPRFDVTPTVPAVEVEKLIVCKEGPAGTYQFSAELTPETLKLQSSGNPVLFADGADGTVDGKATFSVDAGSCLWVALGGGLPPAARRTITVTELPHIGTAFVSATTVQLTNGPTGSVATTTGGNPATALVDGREGATMLFKNRALAGSLSIDKSAGSSTVDAGGQISFTIQVNSNGPDAANNVNLSDPLPTGSSISWTINPSVTGCSITTSTLNCSFGDMAAGASRSVTVVSSTAFASCAAYSNTASASADNVSQVQSTASTTVRCPSLTILKEADQATVAAGTSIGFGITLTSGGPGTAAGVTLSDALPTGTGISWGIDTPVTGCSIASNTLSCNFGDLASGQIRTIHISSPTTSQSCGVYSNTASASASNHGTVQSQDAVTVECQPAVFQGCTPGFWKQKQHFAYWSSPYTTSTLIKNVFSGTAGYITAKGSKPIGDQTLLDGLSFQGGSTIGGAAEILLRAAIAGVLNATNPSVNYPRTAASIVVSVNAALAGGNRTTILNLAEGIDVDNNRGCTAK